MVSGTFALENPSGLHARPAALFVRTAAGLASAVLLEDLDRPEAVPADGKSILAVLTLGAERGHRLRLTVTGETEQPDFEVLAGLIRSGLGEAAGERAAG